MYIIIYANQIKYNNFKTTPKFYPLVKSMSIDTRAPRGGAKGVKGCSSVER